MRAKVDVQVKRVAVLFEDGSIAVNLYTGTDYLDYAKNTRAFSPYKKNLLSTYVSMPYAIGKDADKPYYYICV